STPGLSSLHLLRLYAVPGINHCRFWVSFHLWLASSVHTIQHSRCPGDCRRYWAVGRASWTLLVKTPSRRGNRRYEARWKGCVIPGASVRDELDRVALASHA